MIEEKWNGLDETPPDKTVEVKDEQGNKAYAQPTYFPFDVVKMEGDERKPFGFRGTPVFHEDGESKWDGGWMINVGMNVNKIGLVKLWREIKQ